MSPALKHTLLGLLLYLSLLSHAQEDSTHIANIRAYVGHAIRNYKGSNEKRKREVSQPLWCLIT